MKIGHSTYRGVQARLKSLQTGSPHQLVVRALFDGEMWLEKALHAYFKSSRLVGEWFSVTTDLVLLCPEVVAPDEVPELRRQSSNPYMRTAWTARDGRA